MIKEACGYSGEIVCDESYTDGDAVKILGRTQFDHVFTNFEFYDHKKGIQNTVLYYEERL